MCCDGQGGAGRGRGRTDGTPAADPRPQCHNRRCPATPSHTLPDPRPPPPQSPQTDLTRGEGTGDHQPVQPGEGRKGVAEVGTCDRLRQGPGPASDEQSGKWRKEGGGKKRTPGLEPTQVPPSPLEINGGLLGSSAPPNLTHPRAHSPLPTSGRKEEGRRRSVCVSERSPRSQPISWVGSLRDGRCGAAQSGEKERRMRLSWLGGKNGLTKERGLLEGETSVAILTSGFGHG